MDFISRQKSKKALGYIPNAFRKKIDLIYLIKQARHIIY